MRAMPRYSSTGILSTVAIRWNSMTGSTSRYTSTDEVEMKDSPMTAFFFSIIPTRIRKNMGTIVSAAKTRVSSIKIPPGKKQNADCLS
jgi:hypothetical protein